ncbi:extracellular matrix protein 1 [Clarias gariepinus]|uniref:extracellular matrix protein 1 n=1 Tax=Clarias gariepinus TaxID=13013 RepID=UPI00234D047B|nr:extracellular matrix protein 1 [Clarias gariepinus]
MDSFRGYLVFLTLIAVSAGKVLPDSECCLQMEVGIPTDILEMLKREPKDSNPAVRQKGPHIKIDSIAPSIPFPLAYPTKDNIYFICRYSNRRPRYTSDMLPRSGFGYLLRQANAVNQLESWFTVCCSNGTQDDELTLCCARQAWEKSLSKFCKEEFSVKTSHYHCCKKKGPAKWDCFKEEATDQSYQLLGPEVQTTLPSTVQEFNFSPSSCQETSVSATTPRAEMVTEAPAARLIGQRLVIPQISMSLEEEGPYVFSPRSMRPTVLFPLARPTTTNILAICQYSNLRPRYSTMLPSSGMRRQASAVNQLESWYTSCCANGISDDEMTLCCAQQAWEKSLSAFCKDEFRIKTSHYYCCKKYGPAKWDCFEKAGSDMSYQPSGHRVLTVPPSTSRGFDFDPSICQNSSILGFTSKGVIETPYIGFPPGRPNSYNIGPICVFHKKRPRYLINCLPRTGFDWFARQLKAVNFMEKGFGRCCKEKKDIQACAEGKWKMMVDKFCKDEKKVQVNQFECCKRKRGEEQYKCFSSAAQNPSYMIWNEEITFVEPPHLSMFCKTYTSLKKMKHLPFSVDEMAEKCCTLVEDKRSACLQLQLDNILDDACNTDDPSLAQVKQKCCKKTAMDNSECLTKLLLHKIAKANGINKPRKICPFS